MWPCTFVMRALLREVPCPIAFLPAAWSHPPLYKAPFGFSFAGSSLPPFSAQLWESGVYHPCPHSLPPLTTHQKYSVVTCLAATPTPSIFPVTSLRHLSVPCPLLPTAPGPPWPLICLLCRLLFLSLRVGDASGSQPASLFLTLPSAPCYP